MKVDSIMTTEFVSVSLDDTLFTIKKEFRHMLNDFNCMDYNMVQSCTRILDSLLTPENVPKNMPNEAVVLESYFVFAAIWAFGSGFTITDGVDMRKNFSSWWKSKWTRVKLPTKGSIYDFFVDKATFKFTPWAQIVPVINYDSADKDNNFTIVL